ncbi:hypothetical protein GCM10011348_18110 [Marinobacterium nitratireducens]|uniref:DUF306 domain-containing protein n=2 Tax=Marinobacterium nitratireducens TaxID=518897 RepID=A0A918DRK6_9GAMM|nr:hypothetical protein GCM10011348_18110 [Marinobacterium nitratireducens]
MLATCLWLGGCYAVVPPSTGGGASNDPLHLEGSRWRIETIAGKPLPETIESTLVFGDDGHISGMAGCNRYSGRYRLDGRQFSVEELVTTQKICFPAIMAHEQSLLRVLKGALSLERDAQQLLLESRNEREVSRLAALDGAGPG